MLTDPHAIRKLAHAHPHSYTLFYIALVHLNVFIARPIYIYIHCNNLQYAHAHFNTLTHTSFQYYCGTSTVH